MLTASLIWTLLVPGATAPQTPAAQTVYLSEQPHRILYSQQSWGELGINTCAHQRREKGPPLQIGEHKYEKGLGHHAPGEMIVELGGEFTRFESEVGLQKLPACQGSVAFKVFVDDKERFDSGIMKTDTPPRQVSVPVEGAMELRLVVSDAGDGLMCDCANWADAKLIRSGSPRKVSAASSLDVAPFAEVITCDPARTDGAKSKRVEEYRAEDIFLETPVAADSEGRYEAPGFPMGRCIGLRWLERRLIRELRLDFDGQVPPITGVQAQCWVGESLWQGSWQPLSGPITRDEHGYQLSIDWSPTPEARGATRKIRWILPPETNSRVRRMVAITPTPLETVDLRITLKDPTPNKTATVAMYNGQIVEGDKASIQRVWTMSEPLAMKVRYAKARPWKTDRTVIRFTLPNASFGVAVDDVVKNGGVYVRDAGLFVSKGDMNRDLAGYLATIKDKKTVLQQVREMPDQTFAQAIEHVHHPKQDAQLMLLSLACDNHKFIVHRDGIVQFAETPETANKRLFRPVKYTARMTPKFGSGKDLKITRHLEGGWLPMPITEVDDAGTKYIQRTYVAPYGGMIDDGGSVRWLDRQPVCVVEFSVISRAGNPPSIELQFEADAEKHELPEIKAGSVVYKERLLARFEKTANVAEVSQGKLKLTWPAGDSSTVTLMIPGSPTKDLPPPANALPLPTGFQNYWNENVMKGAMQVELPDPLLTNLIRASQVHCLLAARNQEKGKQIEPWIASISYGPLESESNSIVRGMDYWGHHQFAQRGLDFFIGKYSPTGMLTTGYTLMGTGWHLWTLGEHYQLTQDKQWLQSVAPKVVKVCDWIAKQRAKTHKEMPTGRPPEYGLAPPGVMADWNAYAYYFCLSGYYDKGLLEAARALTGIGYPGSDALLADAKSFRDDILRAYHWAQARMPVYPLRDGTSVPGYPSQLTAPGPTNNFFPGEDGNRSWCYDVELGAHQVVPQGILDPKGKDVTDMMDHMEDVQFLSEGWFDYSAERNEKDWFNLGGFAKVQPYYCRNIEIYALRDDVKPFIRSYFNTIPSLLGLETLSFNEHFAGVAAWNKTHETGYFLCYSRLMLVQERGDELWLAPFVTSNWLADGKKISVRNAPTYFGPVSYELTSHVKDGHVDATITWPTRTKPKDIALRVRHPDGKPIRRVAVDVANGGKGLLHVDAHDPQVVHLEETDPVAHVRIEFEH